MGRAFPKYVKFGVGNQQTHVLVRKHPWIVGVPFVILIVGASFAMVPFTQTRYELEKQQTTQVRCALSYIILRVSNMGGHLDDERAGAGTEE
jgi:hypothetical protein